MSEYSTPRRKCLAAAVNGIQGLIGGALAVLLERRHVGPVSSADGPVWNERIKDEQRIA
jgi:hypothetical protein